MEHIFRIAAVVLAGTAVYFYWIGNQDGMYFSVVLGCVAFFLSIRIQVKERNKIREAEAQMNRESGSDEREQE